MTHRAFSNPFPNNIADTMTSIKRPAPFVLVSTDHGSMIVNRNDYRMVGENQAYGVGFQLLNNSNFDPVEVGVALSILKARREFFGDGVVAIDAGANLGVHTLEWAKTMHGWGRVTAIEAQERVFYALAGNIALNNCLNASAIHAALGAEHGTLDIPVPDYLKPGSFGSLELKKRERTEFIGQTIDYSPENCFNVRLVPLDALETGRVDFIKIDVEGMELEVLDGARQIIERCRPAMMIEAIKTDQTALFELLTNYGYRVYKHHLNFIAIHSTDRSDSFLKVSNNTPS